MSHWQLLFPRQKLNYTDVTPLLSAVRFAPLLCLIPFQLLFGRSACGHSAFSSDALGALQVWENQPDHVTLLLEDGAPVDAADGESGW